MSTRGSMLIPATYRSAWNGVDAGGVSIASSDERNDMRRYLAAAALLVLVLPAVAAAKGPVGASISGPGLAQPLTFRGDGEGPGTALGNLTMASGFFAQVFGQTPDPTLRSRPAGTL